MKLERIKCKPFERAKNLNISESYIIGCTGRKAVVLDKQLNIVHIVENLDYVYEALLSPDETKMLLISTGNKFYIVDMQTFDMTRVTVKAPYNENLEGRGCWSHDGKSVWIPIQNMNSVLRRYWIDDLTRFQDYLKDKYHLDGIQRLEKSERYFLTGYNRAENNKRYFIYFNGVEFREYPLENPAQLLALWAEVDEEQEIVTVAGTKDCWQFTMEGKALQPISHPAPKDKPDMFTVFREPIACLDYVTKYDISTCGRYAYLSSQSGFYVLDAKTNDVLASVDETYGVQNFEEIAADVIAIATWSGVKLYRLVE